MLDQTLEGQSVRQDNDLKTVIGDFAAKLEVITKLEEEMVQFTRSIERFVQGIPKATSGLTSGSASETVGSGGDGRD